MNENERQKEVLKTDLDREKEVLNRLKLIYGQAQDDCVNKIVELSMRKDMENLQSIIWQKQYQEALKGQIDGILDKLHNNEYSTVSEYLHDCYENGYLGTMYDLAGQGIPLVMPIDQDQVVKAVELDAKLTTKKRYTDDTGKRVSLYEKLGANVDDLKADIRFQVSRGIISGSSWNQVGAELAKGMKNTPFDKAINRTITIARTEGHRIQCQAAMDAQYKAKAAGADVLKQWDSTLDERTRETHRQLDGQIRELDDPFEVAGKKAMRPGGFGDPAEDCNCRCALLQRARWALDEEELEELKKRADYFGLSEEKSDDFEEFREKYLVASNEILENELRVRGESYGLAVRIGGDSVPEHEEPKFIKKIDINDRVAVARELEQFEDEYSNSEIENALVILSNGDVYHCYGTETSVYPDFDLNGEIDGAIISHNHPIEKTAYTFSSADLNLFMNYNLETLRGCDQKYVYELTRNMKNIDEQPEDWRNEENFEHGRFIDTAKKYGLGYRRWKNDKRTG